MLQELLNHLKKLNYLQINEAHSIRHKAAEAVRDPILARHINSLKFNTWFLDPVAKRKKAFERARKALVQLLERKITPNS